MAVLDNKKPQPTSVSPVKPQRKGTGFTNLARVMQASQGSKLGQTIAGELTGQAQQVQSGINTAQEEFEKEANKKRIDTELNRTKAIEATRLAADKGEVSADDLGLFGTIKNAEYKGPTELANQQQLQAQAQQVQTLGSLASGVGQRSGTDQGGRQELLRRFVGGADYTSGQRKLDESILSKDKESNIAAAARQTRGVAGEAQRATFGAQAKGQEYGNLAKLFAKETEQRLIDAQTPILGDVTKSFNVAREKEKEKEEYLTSLSRELKTTEWEKKTPEQKKAQFLDYLNKGREYISPEQMQQIEGESGLLKTSDFLNRLKGLDAQYASSYRPNDQFYSPSIHVMHEKWLADKEDARRWAELKTEIAPSQNLDYSSLLGGFSGVNAMNLTESGVASEDQAKKLTALDRLLQKSGTDLQYSPNRQLYQAGGVKTSDVTSASESGMKAAIEYANKIKQRSIDMIDREINWGPPNTYGMYPGERQDAMRDWTNKLNALQARKKEVLTATTEASSYAQKTYDDFIAKRDADIKSGKV
jgi:hypothetical protein